MKRAKLTLWIVALLSVSLLACKTPGPPAVDNTPPSLTLTAFNRASNPIFKSDEGGNVADLCAEFPMLPASFLLSVGDPGGVHVISIKVLGGFVHDSIDVSPGDPESSSVFSPTVGGEVLTVRFTPPEPGIVRTGAFVLFKVDGSAPIAVNAEALDYHNNNGGIHVDARITDDPTTCRGEPGS